MVTGGISQKYNFAIESISRHGEDVDIGASAMVNIEDLHQNVRVFLSNFFGDYERLLAIKTMVADENDQLIFAIHVFKANVTLAGSSVIRHTEGEAFP